MLPVKTGLKTVLNHSRGLRILHLGQNLKQHSKMSSPHVEPHLHSIFYCACTKYLLFRVLQASNLSVKSRQVISTSKLIGGNKIPIKSKCRHFGRTLAAFSKLTYNLHPDPVAEGIRADAGKSTAPTMSGNMAIRDLALVPAFMRRRGGCYLERW